MNEILGHWRHRPGELSRRRLFGFAATLCTWTIGLRRQA
jgi:hypothetical protein